MNGSKIENILKQGIKASVLGILFAILTAGSASACHPGCGMGHFPPGSELADTWILQAEYASEKMLLSGDEVVQLAEIYVASRTSFIETVKNNTKGKGHCRGGGNHGKAHMGKKGEHREVMMKTRLLAVDDFEKAVAEKLGEQKAAEAAELLGFFTPRWDHMVRSLSEMEMDDRVFAEAMDLTARFVVENTSLCLNGDLDPAAMHETCRKYKEELDLKLAEIFTDEQLEQWKSNTKHKGFGHKHGKGGHQHGDKKHNCSGK